MSRLMVSCRTRVGGPALKGNHVMTVIVQRNEHVPPGYRHLGVTPRTGDPLPVSQQYVQVRLGFNDR